MSDEEEVRRGSLHLEDDQGDIAPEATPEDIERALAKPRGDDWFLMLGRGEDDVLEASIEGGALCIEIDEGARSWRASSHIDDEKLKAIMLSFREGGEAWRDLATWVAPTPAARSSAVGGARPPTEIIGFIAGFMVLAGIALTFGGGAWVVVVFALAFPGLIAAATLVKMREVRQAARWKKASGRIVASELTTRTRDGREEKVPRIEYEYNLGFNVHRGTRVSFAEVIAGPDAVAAVNRYPVGTGVSVYYNAENPRESVIERDLPTFFPAIWAVVAVLVAIILGAAWWFLLQPPAA